MQFPMGLADRRIKARRGTWSKLDRLAIPHQVVFRLKLMK